MIHSIEDLDLDNRIFPNHPGKERIKFYTDKEINNMRVADLQAACKECGVRTQGRKAELQARLRRRGSRLSLRRSLAVVWAGMESRFLPRTDEPRDLGSAVLCDAPL